MNEFQLIERYFQRASEAPWLRLGIGDDAAVFQTQPGFDLAVCSDTLVAGRHFPLTTSAQDIGWKSLAVNLSDLAAMGAAPCGFLLNLSLPQADETFLQGFAEGLFELADQAGIVLLGGDTTSGDLSISITAIGQLPAGQSLKRSGAQPQDYIVLVGDLGGAAYGLQQAASASASLQQRLNRPQPLLAEGQLLLQCAHSAIDVSDGLTADLSHILDSSRCGAQLDLQQLPLHPALHDLPRQQALSLALHGGDDYALLCTMDEAAWQRLQAESELEQHARFTVIGRIVEQHGILARDAGQDWQPITAKGYLHFS